MTIAAAPLDAIQTHDHGRTDSYVFTSESVSEGHPDKVCDYIADSILDAHLEQDPGARVACEVLCKGADVVIAGEISSRAEVDHAAVARRAIRELGYVDPDERFSADGVRIAELVTRQAAEIAQGRSVRSLGSWMEERAWQGEARAPGG